MLTVDLTIPVQIVTGSAQDLLAALPDGCTPLVYFDAPHRYRGGKKGHGEVRWIYGGMANAEIAALFAAYARVAAPHAYGFFWITFPKLEEWMDAWRSAHRAATQDARNVVERQRMWRYVTGGAWGKLNGHGVGYHVLGDAELLLLYVKGRPMPIANAQTNLWLSNRTGHSRKPNITLAQFLTMATHEGDLVVDPFAGEYGDLARMCRQMRRRYIGTEIDPARADAARTHLAQMTVLDDVPWVPTHLEETYE